MARLAALARKKYLILAEAFMALVQVSDLSFAVPAPAASLVLETILARAILKKRVDSRRWIGAALVTCGVWLPAL